MLRNDSFCKIFLSLGNFFASLDLVCISLNVFGEWNLWSFKSFFSLYFFLNVFLNIKLLSYACRFLVLLPPVFLSFPLMHDFFKLYIFKLIFIVLDNFLPMLQFCLSFFDCLHLALDGMLKTPFLYLFNLFCPCFNSCFLCCDFSLTAFFTLFYIVKSILLADDLFFGFELFLLLFQLFFKDLSSFDFDILLLLSLLMKA